MPLPAIPGRVGRIARVFARVLWGRTDDWAAVEARGYARFLVRGGTGFAMYLFLGISTFAYVRHGFLPWSPLGSRPGWLTTIGGLAICGVGGILVASLIWNYRCSRD